MSFPAKDFRKDYVPFVRHTVWCSGKATDIPRKSSRLGIVIKPPFDDSADRACKEIARQAEIVS